MVPDGPAGSDFDLLVELIAHVLAEKETSVLSCLINLVTWIYNFNQEIKSDQHWALWNKGQQSADPLFLETETRSRRAYDSGFMRENIVLCEKLPGSAVTKSIPGQVKQTRETNN